MQLKNLPKLSCKVVVNKASKKGLAINKLLLKADIWGNNKVTECLKMLCQCPLLLPTATAL